MIRQTAKTTLVLALSLLAITLSLAEDTAVLVGIDDYRMIVPDLRYAESDVKLIKETLIQYMDFKEENIKMLLGKEATRNGIRLAITDWLKKRVTHGDRAIMYFSGHGMQFDDYSGDEEDGKDELLCAYDSHSTLSSYVKDDDLSSWFREINTDFKMVILDCCHSGTGTKDVLDGGLLNAGEVPLIKEGHLPPDVEIELSESEEARARGVGDASRDVFEDTILLSGCAADQVSMESPRYKHGVLTYYFTQVLNSMADANEDKVVTVEEAVKEATNRIKQKGWKQDPQLEGDFKNKVLIGKRELKETKYGTIEKISAGVITISQGQEHNVVKGSIYNVFDSAATSLVYGKHKGQILIDDVMGSASYARQLEVSEPLQEGDKVVEHSRHFQSENLLLLVEPFKAEDQSSEHVAKGMKKVLEKTLGEEKYVEIVSGGKTPDKILRGSVEGGTGSKYMIRARLVDIKRAEGKDYGPIESTYFRAADSLAKLLIEEIRYSYVLGDLSRLESTNSKFRINLSVDKEKYYIKEDDPERVEVTVQPTRDCYIYLLNIGSSGAITVIFPNAYETDNLVKKGQRYVIPSTDEYAFAVGGPQGPGSIKAIATMDKIDFKRLKPGVNMDNPYKSYKDDVQDTLSLTMKDLRVKPVNRWATESVTYQLVLPDSDK